MANSSDYHTLSIGTDRATEFKDALLSNEIEGITPVGSLEALGLNGATIPNSLELDGKLMSLIFTANDPSHTMIYQNRAGMELGRSNVPARDYERGLFAFHELGGHAWGALLGVGNTDKMSEDFETSVRSIYRVGTELRNGVPTPQYLGGKAQPHRP